jgi:hypothetical protein
VEKMTDAAFYERISAIRAELLEIVCQVGSSRPGLDPSTNVMEDDLIMVTNRLGRVAGQLRAATGGRVSGRGVRAA